MADLRVQTEEVRAAADRIRTLNQEMSDQFEQAIGNLDHLNDDWDGQAADFSYEKFMELRQKYPEQRYRVLDQYVGFLHRQIGEGYESAEKKNTELADQFSAAFR